MLNITHKVLRNLKKIPISKSDKVLVAFSGGKDSMVLTGVLIECGLEVVLCHCDHGIRPESGEDAKKARKFSDDLSVKFELIELHLDPEVSEEEAREERLGGLLSAAEKNNCQYIMTGHTAGDQLETMLMRFCRGSGLNGFCGIPFRNGKFVRPMLNVNRSEIYSYLKHKGWTPIEDGSNQKDAYTRNRFRHHVLPFLLEENPNVEEMAYNLSNCLREDNDTIIYYAEKEYPNVVDEKGIILSLFNALPKSIRARILINFHSINRSHSVQLSLGNINAFIEVAERKEGGKKIMLPGLVLMKLGKYIYKET